MTPELWNKISDSVEVSRKVVELLKEECPVEKTGLAAKSVTINLAHFIFRQKRIDMFDVEAVIKVLATKGISISLTTEEWERSSTIPFSKETLEMATTHQWRGKRAILWWAPPERYEITMLRLREVFGTSKDVQPCVYGNGNEWWLKDVEKFNRQVLREGWHLTLAELPDEMRNETYEKQKALLTKEEELLTPVEAMYLPLVNYLVNDGERLLYDCYSRTDTLDSGGCVVALGYFGPDGLRVGGSYPDDSDSDGGGLVARKFD